MKVKFEIGSVVEINDHDKNGYGVVVNIFKIHLEQLQMAIFKERPESWIEIM
jgi:hypothetical protein